MLLADLGAEVIKVEPPWGEPWRFVQGFLPTESRPFLAYNRGKRSLPLDLTAPESREILGRLVPRTDVALVNYRPDVVSKLRVRVPLPMAKSRPGGDYPGFGSSGHCLTRSEEGVRLPAINWQHPVW